jgi:hypothetical protein
MTKETDYLKMVNDKPDSSESLPSLVRQIQENALSVLLNCLDDLFMNCDDLFFDLSSRADSNSEQNLYFESMRELRVKKHGVINAFKYNVEASFAKLAKGGHPTQQKTNIEPINRNGFSLVQHDDLEQEVSIASMTSKARINCQEQLYHLNTRLDYLISQSTAKSTVTENNNPLDPQQLCNDFASACALFEINIKARIIIFKQFDRHVISRFSTIYSAANNLLIGAGVLPKISSTVNHQHSDQAQPDSNETNHFDALSTNDKNNLGIAYNLLEISGLLNSIRQLDYSSLPQFNTYSSNPGAMMNNQELLNTLSQIQASITDSGTHTPEQDKGSATALNLRSIIKQLLSKKDPAAPQSVTRPDEDIINLVAMFFDFVLDDQAIPIAIQALISRLQIPILKAALKDSAFFSNGNHPARKLVNFMAAASIGWDESSSREKDKFYHKMSNIVHTINKGYVDNEHIFEEQLLELKAFAEQQQHKTALVEKRTSQAVEGKAKTKQAKTVTQALLFEKLEKQKLPEAINTFLVGPWLQLLIIVHIKKGEESAEWLESVQLIDDLVWACQHHKDTRSKERLGKITPDLLRRISTGLANSEQESNDLVEQIQQSLAALQAPEDTPEERPEMQSITAEQASSLGHTPGSGSKPWQEMTAIERQQSKYQALTYDFIKKAEDLPVGSWVSYQDTESGKQIRCKLSTKTESNDTYVFVNRFGFKTLEKSRKEFAYDMQQKRVTELESGLVFDRAMSKVVDQLRQASAP